MRLVINFTLTNQSIFTRYLLIFYFFCTSRGKKSHFRPSKYLYIFFHIMQDARSNVYYGKIMWMDSICQWHFIFVNTEAERLITSEGFQNKLRIFITFITVIYEEYFLMKHYVLYHMHGQAQDFVLWGAGGGAIISSWYILLVLVPLKQLPAYGHDYSDHATDCSISHISLQKIFFNEPLCSVSYPWTDTTL